MKLDPLDIARLWSHAQVARHDQCWPWTAGTDENGYGVFKTQEGKQSAHRAAYVATFGPIEDGLVVRHTCDNPACVNPQHLVTGTHADNVRDRVIRDRSARGERNGRAKLTEDDVRVIRSSDLSKLQLSARYDVSEANIDAIRSGRSWQHVDASDPLPPEAAGMIEVPAELAKRAAGRIFRNDLADPIGGLINKKLYVYPDWRWERFLELA